MTICYNCGDTINYNIYKGYDKSFCCNLCRNNVTNNYVYTHYSEILNNKEYEKSRKYIYYSTIKKSLSSKNLYNIKPNYIIGIDMKNNNIIDSSRKRLYIYNMCKILKKNIEFIFNNTFKKINMVTSKSISSLIYPISKQELDYYMPK